MYVDVYACVSADADIDVDMKAYEWWKVHECICIFRRIADVEI